MSKKKKKLIIFGFLSLGLLISFFWIFKSKNDDSVINVRKGDIVEEDNLNIREQIIKKVGYRPYFIEDENASPLHFSSAFLVDTAISVFITVFTAVALIKTGNFGEALEIIENKIAADDKKAPILKQNSLFSATKYQIILLSVVYLFSFFAIYPLFFILLSLYRKISSLSAFNYLEQLVKKNKILVCLYSVLGLFLSLIIEYLCLYLKAKNDFSNDDENKMLDVETVMNEKKKGLGFQKLKLPPTGDDDLNNINPKSKFLSKSGNNIIGDNNGDNDHIQGAGMGEK